MAKAGAALARRLNKAGALMEAEAFADAAAAYERILAESPLHVEARYNHAVALAQLGRIAEAAAAFQEIIAAQPDVAAAHAALAAALDTYRIDRFEPGIALLPISGLRAPVDAYAAAISAVPVLQGCHSALGEVLMQKAGWPRPKPRWPPPACIRPTCRMRCSISARPWPGPATWPRRSRCIAVRRPMRPTMRRYRSRSTWTPT